MQNAVVSLHSKMRPHILRADISEKRYDHLIKDIEKFTPEYMAFLFVKLREIYIGPFAFVHEVWTLPHITEEQWENYALFSVDDLEEQKLLRKGQHELRMFWGKIYKEISEYDGKKKLLKKELQQLSEQTPDNGGGCSNQCVGGELDTGVPSEAGTRDFDSYDGFRL